MNHFKCALCGAEFQAKKAWRECCSLRCRYKLLSQRKKETLETRLFRYTIKTESCWLFKGQLDPDGYGYLNDFQREGGKVIKTKRVRVHRFSWILHNVFIPEGMSVLHKCDVRNCINPAHLFLGTAAVNQADMVAKGRQCRGERVNTSKLTAAQVIEIRKRYATGERQMTLAKEFGIDRNSVYRIITLQCWKHL